MLYLNQRDYPDLKFTHNNDAGSIPPEQTNVARSGCGMCCVCMIVENLTVGHLSIEECLRIAVEAKASPRRGTRMSILGPAVADKFGLTYDTTDDPDVLVNHLRCGGMAIAHVLGDRDGKPGLFSHVGHYVTVVSRDEEHVCVLDPYMYDGKFEEEGRQGRVMLRHPFAYCSMEDLINDAKSFYLFKRKK